MTEEAREPEKKLELVEETEAEESNPEEPTQEAESQEEMLEEEEVDHPVDRLVACMEEIMVQEKRLASKNSGNLKYELANNVYPLLRTAFSAVIDFIDANEPDENDEIQKMIEENVKVGMENCKRLMLIDDEFGAAIASILSPERQSDYTDVISWAKKSVEETEKAQSQTKH